MTHAAVFPVQGVQGTVAAQSIGTVQIIVANHPFCVSVLYLLQDALGQLGEC